MDPALYRDFKASRGFTYHYYFSPPKDSTKRTILFCHGFPSSSYDWHPQVSFFKKEGYGLIVPDLLGFGGTAKPTTAETYKMSFMVQDIIDILEHEKLTNIIGIAHDWGAVLLSRLAYYHPEYFAGFAFLGVFMPPNPDFEFKKALESTEKIYGYTLFGYWEFFSSDDAPKIIEEHIDSFYSLIFPSDPLYWKEHFAPLGKARAWVESNRIEKRVPYFTDEEWRQHQKNILQGGFASALCWYKSMVHDHTPAEERNMKIDPNRIVIKAPVLFGAALHDYICLPDVGKAVTRQFCPNARIVDFETDHWINLAARDPVNKELLDWIKGDIEKNAQERL
ncbi:hypothetical protein ACEPAF_3436 [Sanghuangporus sanghuang]